MITDSVGNTTSYTYDAVDRQLTDTNSLGKTRSYGYDAVGDLIATTDRNGRNRTYTYDELNRQTAEHWLDAAGNDLRTFNYNYDAVGHLLATNDPDAHYSYTYDLVDRITSIDNLGTTGVPNVLLDYSYDAAGNLLSVTDRIDGILKGTNGYTYDILNRVTQITQSGADVWEKRVDLTYNYQGLVERLQRYWDVAGDFPTVRTEYNYDYLGRTAYISHLGADGSTVANYFYDYDDLNRITERYGTGRDVEYSYDATNQLTSEVRWDRNEQGVEPRYVQNSATSLGMLALNGFQFCQFNRD